MFDCKKTSLYKTAEAIKPEVLDSNANMFEKEMFMENHKTESGNGSVKYTTTGNPILDDFGSLGRYLEPREPKDVFDTMNTLWAVNPLNALKETGYLRMITRDTRYMQEVFKGSRGQGLRHEFNCRMIWLARKHTDVWKKNLLLFISLGSWQDLFDQMILDLSYIHNGRNKILDWAWIARFIGNYLQDSDQCDLIKKYLPTIKNAKSCTTMHSQCNNYIGKYLATSWFGKEDKAGAYTKYRKLKSSGNAHSWQQAISRQDYSNLNFNAIAGRALNKLTNSKFLENNGLEEKFEKWMEEQPVAKFTGYPYELFKKIAPGYADSWGISYINLKNYQKMTINKQFMGLIEIAKQNINRDSKFICAIDTSGSMTADATGTGISAAAVAKSMAVYFSYLLEGAFANTFLEFESYCTMHSFQGSTPLEKFQTPCGSNWGSTNFLSVAILLRDLKNKGYNEEEFPTGVICVSDGEFNRGNHSGPVFEQFLKILHEGGFSKEFVDNFKLVLWDIPNAYYGKSEPKFESLSSRENFYYISGFDPAALAFLTGVEQKDRPVVIPKTPEELMEVALSQDILMKIEL